MQNFADYNINIPAGATGQIKTVCPKCKHKSQSLSVDIKSGVFKCHNASCDFSGTLSDFSSAQNYYDSLARNKTGYLIDNLSRLQSENKIPAVWNIETIASLGIGFDRGTLTFSIFDSAGTLKNFKWHKGKQAGKEFGSGENSLYPLQLLSGYDENKTLIYCAGEKDCISLLSIGLQAVTHTCGEGSSPKDLTPLQRFKNVLIIYDAGNAGIKGRAILADALGKKCPGIEISYKNWHEKYKDGYDVTDYLNDYGPEKFKKWIERSEKWTTDFNSKNIIERICSSPAFNDVELVRLYLFIVNNAARTAHYQTVKSGKRYIDIQIKPGQLVYSPTVAKDVLNISETTTAGRLQRLFKLNLIKIDVIDGRKVITIKDYGYLK